MPKASRFSGLLSSRLQRIALRVRNRMHQLGLSEGELAKRCNNLSKELFPEGARPSMSRERVAKILMNCRPRPGKSAAKVISPQEMVVIALALQVSLEWLSGQYDNKDPVLWDAMAQPQRTAQILHLMAEYEERTGGEVIWAESLLCSMTPPEFAHQYHVAHFAELGQIGLEKEKEELIKVYDEIGNARRKRLFGEGSKRGWELKLLMFSSELRKIAAGEDKYRHIDKRLRRRCLAELHAMIADTTSGVSLVVAEGEAVPHLKVALRDFERIGHNGGEFTLWSYHWGKVGWSEHKSHINNHRRVLDEFQERAAYDRREKVLSLLEQLVELSEKD